ncbi:hypothetical protein tinsulaeT_15870 [Thalassotalea insulae]|uniref:Xaa-Pro dipeptidyl-peptidase C-terminal domain-containing protein n=1 Tax=Thalassotalea insulae TaxID=2056778 RepID=A0ABQ6GS76_9GAMM|nr:CocE/NonD family hydrolase [Thalassotalea insulae]GLX78247.1 hypothetical protein tinsulaeT_15870 [Thalassotalea insulae]
MTNHDVSFRAKWHDVLFICLYLLFTVNSQATETKHTFKTPAALVAANITTSKDALTLLTQHSFHQQLFILANQLSTVEINQQEMFDKVALLSILNRHQELLTTIAEHPNAISYSHYRLHSETLLKQNNHSSFSTLLTDTLSKSLVAMNDESLYQLEAALGWSLPGAQDYAFNIFKRYQTLPTLTKDQAIALIVNSHLYRVLANVLPMSNKLIAQENQKRYHIEPEILITTPDGVELAATIVRKKNQHGKQTAAMQFTIYADEKSHTRTATHAAAHGYIGVVVNSRGKRSSSNTIVPWEHEGEDATSAIDWVSKQAWSNGKVMMYGGSYNGFTQWAAAKHMHPALIAIAPYTAASLITGLPYENNIVLTANYQWAFHVTNNNTVDNSVYTNWQKSNQLLTDFFTSGKAISDIDKLAGQANPWFQKWLQHPSFDDYYQAMVPVKAEYANINIPVLTITGYFDGGQVSAIDYLKRHYRYNQNANHTLLIGPYDHWSAQNKPRSHLGNYPLDAVALEKDTEEIVFGWFDHLLYHTAKPKLLQDKVNYQLMGSNQWRHSSSFAMLNQQATKFYLSTTKNQESNYALQTSPEQQLAYLKQTIDLTDRTTEHNLLPWPIIQDQLNDPNGLVFITAPLTETQELAGAITGHFSIEINKKDVDIGYNFYEIDPSGKAFYLTHYLSRASYANDSSKRTLLVPQKKTTVPIIDARMTAKLLKKGSRLAIVLNVNKNHQAQVNMGSGKEVNNESIADAGEPLIIKWYNDSQINIPLKPWNETK